MVRYSTVQELQMVFCYLYEVQTLQKSILRLSETWKGLDKDLDKGSASLTVHEPLYMVP